jgi:hypothetical protein
MSSPTPLTSFRDTKKGFPASVSSLALDANVHAFAGGIACTGTSTGGGLTAGYGVTGQTSTTLVARGVFAADVDNTGGAAGALTAPVDVGSFWLDNDTTSPCRRQDIDGLCYIIDDHTVSRDTLNSTRSIAGIIRDVGTLGVLVQIGAPFDTVLASEVSARQAITSNLASTSNAKGASLVGIEDALAKITATTVEGALAENIDARRIALGTDGNVLPVPMVMITKSIANSAGDTNIPLDATYGGIKITGVRCVKAAGSSTGGDATITVKNGASAITDAIPLLNITAGLVKDCTTLVPAYSGIASGGTLRITAASAASGDMACTVIITGYRIS